MTPAFGTTPRSCRAPSCATPRACFAPRPATTKPRLRSCAAATTRCSAARTRPCSRGGRRRPCHWPSSTATTRRAPWPPTSCAARGRSARRARSASRCEPLREGLALAARCGARALERRARAELAAIGVRPRTTDRTGADSLTPSERRVVELAATGGTNREIAQTLFVTEKTVETHLGRSFRKLDISSRRQLPEVLARAPG